MYCNTHLNNLTCVLNELLLWSHISSEHPIFVKTVAELSKKNLPANVLERLMNLNRVFSELQRDTTLLKRSMQSSPQAPGRVVEQIDLLMERFLRNDELAISFYPELKRFGMDDKVWLTQIEHITHEQQFMHELFTDLRNQLNKKS